jgi:hypothetical protein
MRKLRVPFVVTASLVAVQSQCSEATIPADDINLEFQNPPPPPPGLCPSAFPTNGAPCDATVPYFYCYYSCNAQPSQVITHCDQGGWHADQAGVDPSQCTSMNPPSCPSLEPNIGTPCPTQLAREYVCSYSCPDDGGLSKMACEQGRWATGVDSCRDLLDAGEGSDLE